MTRDEAAVFAERATASATAGVSYYEDLRDGRWIIMGTDLGVDSPWIAAETQSEALQLAELDA